MIQNKTIFTRCNFQQPVGLFILSSEDLFLLNQWVTSLASRQAEALNEGQSFCNVKSLIAENQLSLLWQNSDEEDGCMGYNRLENRFIVYVSIQKNLLFAHMVNDQLIFLSLFWSKKPHIHCKVRQTSRKSRFFFADVCLLLKVTMCQSHTVSSWNMSGLQALSHTATGSLNKMSLNWNKFSFEIVFPQISKGCRFYVDIFYHICYTHLLCFILFNTNAINSLQITPTYLQCYKCSAPFLSCPHPSAPTC